MVGRPLSLQGACNFRDLGGHSTVGGGTVRAGRVYRSDALHRLLAEDVAILEPLAIGTVFDLRTEREVDKDGVGEFAERRSRRIHMPLVEVTLSPFDPEIDWRQVNFRDRYLEMLGVGGQTIRALFELLAEPDAPALVFHCTGGKDRTGVIAAVLLRTLGVDDETIIDDYACSQIYLRKLVKRYRAELVRLGIDREAVDYLTSSPPERMRRTLAELDATWGSTPGYLDAIGVGPTMRDALERNLIVVGG